MFSKDKILQDIISIRSKFGFPRIIPEIRETVYSEKKDTLYIIAEDRADKSNMIGSSRIIGELRKKLNIGYITVISYPDLLKKREILKKNLQKLKKDPVSIKLKEYLENELDLKGEMINFPIEGKSLVIPCRNLHSVLLSKILGFDPVILTVRLTYPNIIRDHESIVIEEKIQDCDQCREITMEKALEYARENEIPIIFGDFDEDITYDEVILLNPTKFFWLSRWERKNLVEREDRCIRLKNDTFFKKILQEVYDGLCEPTIGAIDVYKYYEGRL